MADDPHDIIERVTITEHGQPVTFLICRCGMVHDAMDLDVMDCEIGALEEEFSGLTDDYLRDSEGLKRDYLRATTKIAGRIERRKATGRRNAQRIEAGAKV